MRARARVKLLNELFCDIIRFTAKMLSFHAQYAECLLYLQQFLGGGKKMPGLIRNCVLLKKKKKKGCTSGGVYIPCIYTLARVTVVFVVVLVLRISSAN